ncbi:uncharacterized protein LOC142351931 [Convolutriloba macropyga]|uniref:uncharacterized protein LOC142351931 n=1 Tax=Convolutriloba macropyga TaxID=536237 RepID=UPI003F51BF53
MNDMFKRDLPKRLNDPAIRKIFFITTDGLPTSCTSNIQPYLKIPVTIFAIGSRSKVEWGNLVEMARGDPDHAKNNKYPSEVSYDFKAECNAGSQCNLVVKHPAQFANAVCVQNSKGTKEYTVAIIATGGTGPEDLTAVNNVGSNIGGDYSSAENNDTSKPSKKQVIVQARMGVASRLLVSDFLLIVRFILITYGYVG